MTKKDKLLKDLHHHTFAMLKPSPLHGIGVFAVTAIKKGEQKIFSSHEAETHYYIPEYGFKVFDLAVYLNHSEQPNLISINDGEFFEAVRDIEAGEELLIDYGTIVESEE